MEKEESRIIKKESINEKKNIGWKCWK